MKNSLWCFSLWNPFRWKKLQRQLREELASLFPTLVPKQFFRQKRGVSIVMSSSYQQGRKVFMCRRKIKHNGRVPSETTPYQQKNNSRCSHNSTIWSPLTLCCAHQVSEVITIPRIVFYKLGNVQYWNAVDIRIDPPRQKHCFKDSFLSHIQFQPDWVHLIIWLIWKTVSTRTFCYPDSIQHNRDIRQFKHQT